MTTLNATQRVNQLATNSPAQPKKPTQPAPSTGVQVFFTDTYKRTKLQNEQTSQNNPLNPDKVLVKLIDSATQSLDGSFYDINTPSVVDAFIRAEQRGVEVRLVTDSDNMVEKEDPTQSRLQINRLKAGGVEVKDDNRSGIMHNKFLVADHQSVWTGSTNLTPSSLYQHNNDALQFNSREMAANYDAEFARLWNGQFSKVERTVPYPEVDINGIKIKTFFSPKGNGIEAVREELQKAEKSIQFMTFSLTDPDIGQILIDKHNAGLKVEGIFDTWLGAGAYSLYPVLQSAGLPVYKDGNEALLHHKLMIIDGKTIITGSYNYSKNAENSNNENFVIIKNAPEQVKQYQDAFAKTLAIAKMKRQNPVPQKQPTAPVVPVPVQQAPLLLPGNTAQPATPGLLPGSEGSGKPVRLF